jgi:hypothetical protein
LASSLRTFQSAGIARAHEIASRSRSVDVLLTFEGHSSGSPGYFLLPIQFQTSAETSEVVAAFESANEWLLLLLL